MLSAVLELDDLCFGGLWTLEGYQRELDSPNSVLLGLFLEDSRGAEGHEVSWQEPPNAERGSRGAEEQRSKGEVFNYPHPLSLTPHPSPLAPNSSLLSIGCFWEILDEAHITLLAVHPHYQSRGLGQAMLLALIACAVERGLERATLEVRASNLPALSLYKKFGFKLAGRRRGYYKQTNEDALIFWRGDLQEPEFQTTLAESYQFVSDRLQISGWHLNLILN